MCVKLLAITRKTRIIDVLYNASNNELVRTKTLVKNCIISIDCTPFRTWYEAHYALPLGKKKGAKLVRIIGLSVYNQNIHIVAFVDFIFYCLHLCSIAFRLTSVSNKQSRDEWQTVAE